MFLIDNIQESLNSIIIPIKYFLNYFTNWTAEIWTCALLIIIALYITITEIIKYSGYDKYKKNKWSCKYIWTNNKHKHLTY